MSEVKNNTPNTPNEEPMKLDDAQRVKALSPGMLVAKRFFRNRLAITGLIILVAMFLFSYLGALIIPYGESQVFYRRGEALMDYASISYNTDLRYTVLEGMTFDNSAKSAMMLAVSKGNDTFEAGGVAYRLEVEADNFYRILSSASDVRVNVRKNLFAYEELTGNLTVDDAMKAAFEQAYREQGEAISTFTLGDTTYDVVKSGNDYYIGAAEVLAIASLYSFDPFREADTAAVGNVEFRAGAELALVNNETSFTVDDVTYGLQKKDGHVYITLDGENFATMSTIVVSAAGERFVPAEFKIAARDAVQNGEKSITFDLGDGRADRKFELQMVNTIYYAKTMVESDLVDIYASPSQEHLLGTDANGMDMLTRLIYGGQVSLRIGFVVMAIELLIGVTLGGISGYFGGWVDTCIMRFVDLFNSIPQMPMMIIIGSILDAYKVSPEVRITLVMMLLGILGWTGIARVVRGQILSLREQDFMIATEATGVRVSRRIFRHLVPNVMPLLIVQATMGLGGIIISEATLSFLGLGVKYPLASWGSIINAATDIFVMTNYWWAWIPAGSLILITVLGFNFVGDGLRDAFDPKMKR